MPLRDRKNMADRRPRPAVEALEGRRLLTAIFASHQAAIPVAALIQSGSVASDHIIGGHAHGFHAGLPYLPS